MIDLFMPLIMLLLVTTSIIGECFISAIIVVNLASKSNVLLNKTSENNKMNQPVFKM